MYRDGDGVERDMGEAVRWFRQAAEKADTASFLYISEIVTAEEVPVNDGIRDNE
jgi:TPR repeat protein